MYICLEYSYKGYAKPDMDIKKIMPTTGKYVCFLLTLLHLELSDCKKVLVLNTGNYLLKSTDINQKGTVVYIYDKPNYTYLRCMFLINYLNFFFFS